MLVGPRGHLVFVVALVGRMALLWPLEDAMAPRSAALEREPAQKTAPVLLVSNEYSCDKLGLNPIDAYMCQLHLTFNSRTR